MKIDLSQLNVLCVDDDAHFRIALARMLGMLGYHALHAGSAEDAVQVLGTDSVDLMLLDLQLPGVHGHALMRNMTQNKIPIPVVIMSGVGSMDDVVQAMRQQAVDFLRKPFSAEELRSSLERAKARKEEMRLEGEDGGDARRESDTVPPSGPQPGVAEAADSRPVASNEPTPVAAAAGEEEAQEELPLDPEDIIRLVDRVA